MVPPSILGAIMRGGRSVVDGYAQYAALKLDLAVLVVTILMRVIRVLSVVLLIVIMYRRRHRILLLLLWWWIDQRFGLMRDRAQRVRSMSLVMKLLRRVTKYFRVLLMLRKRTHFHWNVKSVVATLLLLVVVYLAAATTTITTSQIYAVSVIDAVVFNALRVSDVFGRRRCHRGVADSGTSRRIGTRKE